ncbi:hypothetical protein [Halarchaeum salinum]|uniref:hypothetical protein n=1 Tax=Halarchaeum salinum TaxID=489912 RepID=UPI0031D9D477
MSVFLALVAMGLVVSLATVGASAFLTMRGRSEPLMDAVGGLLGALLWGICALSATNLEVVTDSGLASSSEPMLTYFFVALAAGMTIIGVMGTTFMLDVFDVEATNRR